MTKEELKELCEWAIKDTDPNQWHVTRNTIATECLRLLKQVEAMRMVVDAAKVRMQAVDDMKKTTFHTPDEILDEIRDRRFAADKRLYTALKQLKSPGPSQQGK